MKATDTNPREVMQFLQTRRSYRRFAQTPVPQTVVEDILEAARLASSAANCQPIKYVVVQTPQAVAQVNALVRWAGYLPKEQGTPAAGEEPVLYVGVVQDEAIRTDSATDAGLAIANMTAAAWASGVGSCILGAIDRPALMGLFGLSANETCKLHTMVAFGYPAHESRVVEMKDGNVKYYLDENRDYYVPKRPLAELVLGRL